MSSASLPRVPVARVYEKLDRHGRRTLEGRLGVAKLVIVATEGESRGQKVWHVYLGHGPLPLDEFVHDPEADHG
jgi:hypothetical protein